MKKIRISKRFLVGALVLLLVFTPISFFEIFSGEYFKAEAQEEEIISGYQEWNTDKTIDNNVLIESDATLIIKQGVTVTFDGGEMDVYGTMVASGTTKNPVVFKKSESPWGYSISVKTDGKLIMRNADISGGGYNAYVMKEKSIFNNALAYGYITGGIDVVGGWLYVEGSNFHDNETAIYVSNQNPNRIKVNKNRFSNNNNFDVYYRGSSGNNFDFKYNWWGNSDGPPKICDSSNSCWYGKFEGEVNFSNWLTAENFRDPVIIIPGILGSEKEDGVWQIDPVFHTYDNLYEEFIQNGYVPEKDLFTFPYEWRNSNIENAQLLKVKIQEIKQQENWPSVDIIAHSMGGLLAREYIESDYYDNDINQLIMLGTPNNGAPEAYLKWEAGAFFTSLQDVFMKYYFKHEAKEKGYNDLFYYIREVVPSVKELLPTYGYLYDVENNESLLEYPANYPFNNFLDNLNSQTEKEKLLQVELSKIIGNVNDSNSTITGFKVIKTDMGDYWEHGYPHGFEIPLIGDGGMINGYGDQTVPLESAKSENIFSDNLIEINASHRELPTEAQEDIIEILTGIRPINKMEDSLIRDILFVSVFSPIDIQVIDPNNKKVGKDFTTGEIINEIEGAYYSGSGTENEFLTIPNPVDGEYKILTQGTGDGAYKIEATKITEDPDTGIAGESTATISGTATPGQEEEKEVTVEGNNVTTGNQDTVPPTITGSVTVQPNAKGWYNSDVTVHFEATDDESGIDFVTPDVIITTEGKNQSVTGIAKDKAGNEASFTVSGINIDKTAPEVKIIFNQVSQKLDVLGVDDLSQNVSVVMGERAVNQEPEIKKGKFSWLLDKIKKGKKEKKKKNTVATLSDEAGHQTEIIFEKKKDDNHQIDISLQSIAYNGVKTEFSKSLLQYKWFLNWRKKKYNLFGSHIKTDSGLLEAHYRPKKNETWIMEKPRELDNDDNDDDVERRSTRKKLPGMVVPYLQTEQGKIKSGY